DKALDKIYKDAKLTENQIDVLEALERTQDNYNNREIYTKVDAAKILSKTPSNTRKTFHSIKNKIIDTYNNEVPTLFTRKEKINYLNNFLDSIEDEEDIVKFVLKHRDEDFMYYLLYENNIDSKLVQYFNINCNNQDKYHTDYMRKFC